MARINIEDQFWVDVVEVAVRMGDSDKAVGQAMKLIRFAQDRFKEGREITRAEFEARFSAALVPEFAQFDGDIVRVAGATKHFGWLKERVTSGSKGGSVKSEKKRQAAVNREKRRRDDHLQTTSKTEKPQATTSKLKQPQASYSSSPSSSPSSSNSFSSEQKKLAVVVEGNGENSSVEDPMRLRWILELWSSHRGNMPEVSEIQPGSERHERLLAAVAQYPDHADWVRAFELMASSEYVSGRSGKWSGGGLDWLIAKRENFEKVLNGNFNPETRKVKGIEWGDRAKLVLEGVARFGDMGSGPYDLRKFLGDELWGLAMKCDGGFYAIRRMPNKPSTVHLLAIALRAASEISSVKPPSLVVVG